MSRTRDERYRSLLRWYPRSWRSVHGAVLLSTWLDAAEHAGRDAPTAGEAFSAALHGTAARMNRRFAVAASVAGVLCAVAAGVVSVWATAGWLWLIPLLLSGAMPALTAAGLIAALRERGTLGDARAISAVIVAGAASVLNVLAYQAWSLGWDAADAGVPAGGLAAAWLPLTAAAVLTGGMGIALIIEALFARARVSMTLRIVLAETVGFTAAPVVGLGLLSPAVAAGLAIGVALLALLPRRRAAATPSGPETALVPDGRETAPTRAAAESVARPPRDLAITRAFAWVALVGCGTGAAYALSGTHWSPGAVDGTAAVASGISIMLVSGVPLLAAIGSAASSPTARRERSAQLTLLALGLGFVAIAYLFAPGWSAMSPWLQASAVAIGAALAWWIAAHLPLGPRGAAVIGILSGLLYAAFAGVLVAPMLAFAVPVGAVVVLVRHRRRAAPAHRRAARTALTT